MRSFNVSVLHAFSTSAERWDEHIDRHSEYARAKNSTDCTHFCEPSSLMATLNGISFTPNEAFGAALPGRPA